MSCILYAKTVGVSRLESIYIAGVTYHERIDSMMRALLFYRTNGYL